MKNIIPVFLFLSSGLMMEAESVEHLKSHQTLPENSKFENVKSQVTEYLKGSWCSAEKANLIMELIVTEHLRNCVEVGAFTGSSALPILAALRYLNQGHVYLIDAWSNQEAVKGLNAQDPNAIWWSTLDMKAVKNQLLHMVKSWNLTPYCTIIHATSEKAVQEIQDIEFLHLDGNFSEEGAFLDSELYLPKVRSGGYILLSNVLFMTDQKPSKMKSLWPIFDQCDIVGEIDSGNAILFKKS